MPTRDGAQRRIKKPAKRAASHTAARTRVYPVPRPVLVATDGSKASGAAIQFASAMADAGAWKPEATTVFEPIPVTVADVALPAPAISEPESTQGLIGIVRRQIRRFGGASWSLQVQFGSVARAIVKLAHDHKSQIIVIGLGKHGRLARLLGAETAARICRLSDIPVLAVDMSLKALPHTALVAMDFGESSVRAAREALALLQPPGRMHLLHVSWTMDGHSLHDPAWDRTYAAGVEHGFDRLRMELSPPEGIEITSELRNDGVISSILKIAKDIDADLLALGSHSQNVIDRMIIGSTTSQLLRAAKCSVLVTPPIGPAGSSKA